MFICICICIHMHTFVYSNIPPFEIVVISLVGGTVCQLEALEPLESAILKMSTCFSGRLPCHATRGSIDGLHWSHSKANIVASVDGKCQPVGLVA